MKRILMITGDFVEDYENMVPFQALKAMGHEVDAVSPGKKSGDTIATSIHDFEGEQTYSEKRGHNFELNATFEDVDLEDYDALYVPGGRSPEYLRLDDRVVKMVRHFFKANKPVASVCHGPQVFTGCGVLQGKKVSAYPACGPEIKADGAEYSSIEFTEAITDGNLVTAPAWPAHPELIRQFNALLVEG
ncbi:MAG: DJ-1/PfpI family protein [Planctomycetota bacterium]